jgi:single-strand DNA-binding protein
MNTVFVLGYVGADPVIRYTPKGVAVATFSLATNEHYKDASGNKQQRVEWHRVVFFGARVESLIEPYVKKGEHLNVQGSLRTRKWRDEKANVDRYVTEIIGDRIELLSSKRDDTAGGEEEGGVQTPPPKDDDIPF